MKVLRYEKVGDISATYSFLEVYFEGDNEVVDPIRTTYFQN